MAEHSVLQYLLPDAGGHEHDGCAHFLSIKFSFWGIF